MITCGKCGFSQPKDVYCANCGINLQNYRPKKSPFFIRALKDPYVQIGGAVVFAFVAFTFLMNIPQKEPVPGPNVTENANITNEEPLAADSNSPEDNPLAPSRQKKALVGKKIEISARPEVLEKVERDSKYDGSQDEEGSFSGTPAAKKEASPTLNRQEEDLNSDPLEGYSLAVSVFEYNNSSSLFTGSSSVSRKMVKKEASTLSGGSFIKTDFESLEKVGSKKEILMDYTLENFEDGQKNGLMISYISQKSEKNPKRGRFNLRISAKIPLEIGTQSSIDWERVVFIKPDEIALFRIKLPKENIMESFLETTEGTPLALLNSPTFIEGKLDLVLAVELQQ